VKRSGIEVKGVRRIYVALYVTIIESV